MKMRADKDTAQARKTITEEFRQQMISVQKKVRDEMQALRIGDRAIKGIEEGLEIVEVDEAKRGKDTTDKARLSLVPPGIIEAVGEVRTFGTEKYGCPENWKTVEPEFYVDALMRHLVRYLRDPKAVDEESGLSHLAHMACNIAFLIEMEDGERGKITHEKDCSTERRKQLDG